MRKLPGTAWCLPFVLLGCASLPAPADVAAPLSALAPAQWQVPLPHNGRSEDLGRWWQQHGDALLVELIDAAQSVSPSLAAAKSRIGQSRAALAVSRAAMGPTLDASASAARSVTQPDIPLATTLQAGLLAAWEVDLFGAASSASAAAAGRLSGAQAMWHDARVSVAAEVANQYLQLVSCTRQSSLARQDGDSRAESVRLLGISTRAGFTANGDLELGKASAADAANQLVAVGAQCDVLVKGLVALTGFPEPDLRARFAQAAGGQADLAPVHVAVVPAEALNQRPDLYAAARDIDAAAQDLASYNAQRYPRLSLNGSIGSLSVNAGGLSNSMATWSIGPVTLSVPLLDGGRRLANVEAAQYRYDEAVAIYRAKVRQAIREVEQALVNLQAARNQRINSEVSAQAWRDSLDAVLARQRSGFASQIDVENTRRMALAAETGRLALQRDQLLAWVALYRAVGGGWQPAAVAAADPDKTR